MFLTLRYRRIMRDVRGVYGDKHRVIMTECGMTPSGANAKRLIQSAGGRIELRASGDLGTTFCISLPAAVSGTPTAPGGSIPPPPRVAADAEAVRVSSHPLA